MRLKNLSPTSVMFEAANSSGLGGGCWGEGSRGHVKPYIMSA